MTLQIAIDGIGKSTQADLLIKFFKKKNYKVCKATQPQNKDIIQILKKYQLCKHEIALLMAFDRSLTYYNTDFKDYDIVIWDSSIISCYTNNTDEYTPKVFIKQINRYFPEMDLYILINDTEEKITHKNTVTTPYLEDEPIKTHENIVKLIFENLPRCQWCGRLFTPTQKHKKYCTDKCSKYSLEEQYRENNRNYYHRYKDVMSERQKGGLGSKNANLHGTPDTNPLRELEKVRNAKKALGLKPIQ